MYPSGSGEAARAISGTLRAALFGTPRPVCQVGWANTVLAPPPPAAGLPVVLSFQTVSGMYEMAEPRLALLAAFQYWAEPSRKVVPPTPVTSGTSAGESTASPAPLLEVPDRQSAPPESPAAFTQVMPCAFAWRAPDCLARRGLHGEHVRLQREGFAEAVADTEYGGEILVDGILHGVRNVVGVDIDQGRLGSGGASPLKIEIGFTEIAFDGSGIFGVGDENQLGIGSRKLKLRAKLLDVGQVDSGLAGRPTD